MDKTIEPIIISLPVWEEQVWEAVQRKDFAAVKTHLQNYLLCYSLEEWDEILWGAIIKGFSSVRGYIDETTWETKMIPVVAQVLFTLAPPPEVSRIYGELDLFSIQRIHNAFINSLGAKETSQRLQALRGTYPNHYNFCVALPAQVLGMEIVPAHSGHAVPKLTELKERYDTMPNSLREKLLAAEAADFVYRMGKKLNLSDDKIGDLGKIVGLALLGATPLDEMDKEISKVLAVDPRISQEVEDELLRNIFNAVTSEIETGRMMYVAQTEENRTTSLPVDFITTGMTEKPVVTLRPEPEESPDKDGGKNVFKKGPTVPFGFPGLMRKKDSGAIAEKTEVKEAKPFVLYEDRAAGGAAKARTTSAPGFSLPFGFFGKSGGRGEVAQKGVKASIDFGGAGRGSAPTIGILGKITKKEEARTVHYGGTSSAINISGQESDAIKEAEAFKTSLDQPIKPEGATIKIDGTIKTIPAVSAIKPMVETASQKEEVMIKTSPASTVKNNPFGFPIKNSGVVLDGNTVHINGGNTDEH